MSSCVIPSLKYVKKNTTLNSTSSLFIPRIIDYPFESKVNSKVPNLTEIKTYF